MCFIVECVVRALQVFDKKGRGYITSSALRTILTKGGDTPFEGDVDFIIRQVDTKGNGRIYYEGSKHSPSVYLFFFLFLIRKI